MKWVVKLLKKIINLPNTIKFNFKAFPLNIAILLPVSVHYKVKVGKIPRNSIKINSTNIKRGMIEFGFKGAGFVSASNSSVNIWNSGMIIFEGSCVIAEGFNIHCNNGILRFGNDFYANRNLTIQCEKQILFGDNDLLGWNVSVRDTDGHRIYEQGQQKPMLKEVNIENHVWIASDCTILKGTQIASDSVIGCNSLVCGIKVEEKNSLIAGSPAKVKKTDIVWNK